MASPLVGGPDPSAGEVCQLWHNLKERQMGMTQYFADNSDCAIVVDNQIYKPLLSF